MNEANLYEEFQRKVQLLSFIKYSLIFFDFGVDSGDEWREERCVLVVVAPMVAW